MHVEIVPTFLTYRFSKARSLYQVSKTSLAPTALVKLFKTIALANHLIRILHVVTCGLTTVKFHHFRKTGLGCVSFIYIAKCTTLHVYVYYNSQRFLIHTATCNEKKTYLDHSLRHVMSHFLQSKINKKQSPMGRPILILFICVLHKRPKGHIAHLRKHFKSLNTYDYIITLIRKEKNLLLTL